MSDQFEKKASDVLARFPAPSNWAAGVKAQRLELALTNALRETFEQGRASVGGNTDGLVAIAKATKKFLLALHDYRERPLDEYNVATDDRISCVEDLEDELIDVVNANKHVFGDHQ
jgi:hypothetical protein